MPRTTISKTKAISSSRIHNGKTLCLAAADDYAKYRESSQVSSIVIDREVLEKVAKVYKLCQSSLDATVANTLSLLNSQTSEAKRAFVPLLNIRMFLEIMALLIEPESHYIAADYLCRRLGGLVIGKLKQSTSVKEVLQQCFDCYARGKYSGEVDSKSAGLLTALKLFERNLRGVTGEDQVDGLLKRTHNTIKKCQAMFVADQDQKFYGTHSPYTTRRHSSITKDHYDSISNDTKLVFEVKSLLKDWDVLPTKIPLNTYNLQSLKGDDMEKLCKIVMFYQLNLLWKSDELMKQFIIDSVGLKRDEIEKDLQRYAGIDWTDNIHTILCSFPSGNEGSNDTKYQVLADNLHLGPLPWMCHSNRDDWLSVALYSNWNYIIPILHSLFPAHK